MSNNEEGSSHSNTNNAKLEETAQSEITVVTDLQQQQQQVIDHGGSDENIVNNSVDPENVIHDGTNNISNNETNNNATDMAMMEDARITASTLATTNVSTTTTTEENSSSPRQHNSTPPVGVSVDGSTTYESTTVETVAAAIAAAEAVNEEVSNIPAALPMNLDQGGLPVEVEHHHHHTNMEQHGGAKDVNAGVGAEVEESMDLQNHVMNHTGDNNNTIAQSHDQAAAAAAVAEATAASIMNFNNFVPQDHAQSQHCVGLEGETHQIVGTEVLPSLPTAVAVGDGTTPDSLVVNDQYAASHHHVAAMMGTATGVVSNTAGAVGVPMAPQDAAAAAGMLNSNSSITEAELAALDPSVKQTYHGRQLAIRRVKDRNRYWSMSADERNAKNAKRREKYKHQRVMEKEAEQAPDGEGANPDLFQQIINRKKIRRDKERERYHALDEEAKKVRNQKRAARERERYHALTPDEKAERNRRRRERAAELRARKKQKAEQQNNTETISAANAIESEGLAGVDVGSIVPTIEGTVEDSLVSSVSPDALQLAVQTAKDSMEQHLHDHAVSTSLSEADNTDAAAATAAAAAISASSAVIGGSNITAL